MQGTDLEAFQRAYLLRHQAMCAGQVLGPRSDNMTKRIRQMLHRTSRALGHPLSQKPRPKYKISSMRGAPYDRFTVSGRLTQQFTADGTITGRFVK